MHAAIMRADTRVLNSLCESPYGHRRLDLNLYMYAVSMDMIDVSYSMCPFWWSFAAGWLIAFEYGPDQ